jgi:flagellar motility protein MotE (MotC chaperone)
MIRAFISLAGFLCFAIVVAEACAVGALWSRGHLSAANFREIRLILAGQQPKDDLLEDEKLEREQQSYRDVQETRLTRVLDLETRARELDVLKTMTSETANELISDRQEFDEKVKAFRQELQNLQTQLEDASTRQTRAILLASQPADAAERLMGLDPGDAVRLLTGMPEKSIAKILQAFGKDQQMAVRGQELFEELVRGGLRSDLLRQAADSMDEPNTPEATP